MKRHFNFLIAMAIAPSIMWAQTPAADQTIGEYANNTDKSYAYIDDAISVASGKSVNVLTSRYTRMRSTVSGSGRVNIILGGERVFLGSTEKNNTMVPDWDSFNGDVHIYKNESTSNACQLIWYNKSQYAAGTDIATGKLVNCFKNATVTVHSGAAIAAESNNLGIRIGHLTTEAGGTIYSYYKSKANVTASYVLGFDNKDSELAGDIIANGSSAIAIAKEGTGTYRISGNSNNINGGIRILEGAIAIVNDASAAKSGSLTGATGANGEVMVGGSGTLTGTGNVGMTVNTFGVIAPGDKGIGTLYIENYSATEQPTLRLHPASRIDIEVASATSHDKLIVGGAIELDNRTEAFETSSKMPYIYVTVANDANLKVGDKLTLMTVGSKSGDGWKVNIKCNDNYTWELSEVANGGKTDLVATLVSLSNTFTLDDGDDDTFEMGYTARGTWDMTAEKALNTTLRKRLNQSGKHIGVAVRGWDMDLNDMTQPQPKLIAQEFNAVVCENEMKFDAVHPAEETYSYGDGDKLVKFAQNNDMYVRGHTLVWHSQVPAWVSADGKKNDKGWTREQLLDIMKTHIQTVVGHWKGKVKEWDVCNEVLDDVQTSIMTDPTAFDLRQTSVWASVIGSDFIEKAFQWAHEADPDALLILNDYGVEFKGVAKTEALYNLAKSLKDKGVPIDGVGLQCHLDVGNVDEAKLAANIRRYNDIGLLCNITELDLGLKDGKTEAQQADDFNAITNVFLGEQNCQTLMIWGLRDSESWRTGSNPLLFDGSLNAKSAYYGVRAALGSATPVDDIEASDAEVVTTELYNLMGMKVAPGTRGIVIERQTLNNGTTRTRKVLVR